MAQTNTEEIAYLLLVANQWQNVNKIHPSRGKSKTLHSHPCTLPTVVSHLSSGSSWGQLLWWSAPKKQTWRQVLVGEWSGGAQTVFVRALYGKCSQYKLWNKRCSSLHVPTASSAPHKPTALNE